MYLPGAPIAPAMRVRHREKPRLAAAASLAALSGFLLLGCSAGDPNRDPGIDFGPANIPLPHGQWAAIGTVLKGEEMSNEPPGTVLKRPWTFKRVCDPSCHRVFLRWTLYGPSITRLVAHGRFYTANFPPVEVPCVYPRGSHYTHHRYGGSHDNYKLWWSADGKHVHAMERQTETGCYPTPGVPTLTRWSASRAGRPPS